MLFEAAILSTSAAVSSVAEAFALPEISFQITVAGEPLSVRALTADTPLAALGGDAAGAANAPGSLAAVDPAALPTLRGVNLLEQLALLPGDALAEFVSTNGGVVSEFLTAQPSAAHVKEWWARTDLASRSTFLESAPGLVGNLEGVPFALRDYANRRALTLAAEQLHAEVGASGARSRLIDASGSRHMLQQITDALDAPPGAPPRYLLSLDTSGAGTASIVIGDIESADFVSYLVPGMFYTVDGQMVAWAAAAQSLYDTQTEWIDHLSTADPALRDASVATVAWLGYETPSMVNFTSLELALEGRDAIASTINGIRELRGDDQPFLSLVAHSYGSTAAMMALTDYGIEVDALALIGSPGTAATSASDLGVRGDNVFVGEAAWDQIEDTAFFGTDPGSASFGAHAFSVDGGADPITGADLAASTGHNAYLDAGSESMRNLALISIGRGYLITTDGDAPTVKRSFAGLRQSSGPVVAVAASALR